MLGGMRKLLDKYQKFLLVLLAGFLVAVFTIPFRQQSRTASETRLGTLYGEPITRNQLRNFHDRWRQLGLEFFRINPRDPNENYVLNNYWLLRAAGEHGVRISENAVRDMLRLDPPQRQRIEYVVAAPQALAGEIKPSDEELRAHHKTLPELKAEPFAKVKAKVAQKLKFQRAKELGDKLIRALHAKIHAMPRQGNAWRHAISRAADQQEPKLVYQRSRMFTEKNAADMLPHLVERPDRRTSSAKPRLPEDLAKALFNTAVGEPSALFSSGDRVFFFRVLETSAGYTSAGVLVNKDYGWRNGQFVVLEEYASRAELVKAKRGMSADEMRRSFEEYLTVQKFVALTCGGPDRRALLARDTAKQLFAFHSERVQSLAARIPVAPFLPADTPTTTELLEFYEARKADPPRSLFGFGYLQPERVHIEYVLAGLDQLEALKAVKAQAESAEGAPQPLEGLAEEAGLEYKTSARPFARHEAGAVVPGLAEAPEFVGQAFDENLRPRHAPGPGGQPIYVRPSSPTLGTKTKRFFFRLLKHLPPHAAEFAALGAAQRAQIAGDWRRERGVQGARDAAQRLRVEIARRTLRALAADNHLSVESTTVQPGELAGEDPPVPPALIEHVSGQQTAGGITRLVRHGDVYYTAVTTQIDELTGEVHLDYISLTPTGFTAEIAPSPSAVAERARKLRDDARTDESGERPKPKTPPTAEQTASAKAELIREWREKGFEARYREYLQQRLCDTFCNYLASLKLERATTPEFLRQDDFDENDASPLRGDKKLLEAAAALKKGALAGPVVGDKAAAILLLAEEASRPERKLEILSVQPGDYDPLDVTVTAAEAKTYHTAHREEFRRPDRARAEFVFASFKNVGSSLEDKVTDKQVEDHYAKHEKTAYPDRPLDDVLRRVIRSQIARESAEAQDAERLIRDLLAAAGKQTKKPLAELAKELDPQGVLVAGTTRLLEQKDSSLHRIGNAPALVRAILAARPGVLGKPTKTGDGWTLFRVTQRVKSHVPTFDAIAPAVRAAARKKQFADKAQRALEKIRAAVDGHEKVKMADLLKRPEIASDLPFDTMVHTTGYLDFERAEARSDLSSKLRKAAFSAKPGKATPVFVAKEGVQFARVLRAQTNRLVKVHYIVVPADLFAGTIDVTDEDAEEYYDTHQDKYERKRHYELEVLIAKTPSLKTGLEPSDKEVQDAYDQVRHDYVDEQASREGTTAYKLLKDVRKEIEDLVKNHQARDKAAKLVGQARDRIAKDKTQSFEALAKELKGLDHEPSQEYTPGGDANPRLLERVAGLDAFLGAAESGDTSGPLLTSDGPLVVRVKKIRDATVTPLDEVRGAAQREVATFRGLVKATRLAERVLAKIKAVPTDPASKNPLAEAMAKAVVPPEGTAGLGKDLALFATPYQNREEVRAVQGNMARQIMRMPPQYMRFAQPYLSRLYATTLDLSMFDMRYGEISEPVRPGEKTDACYLGILTGVRHDAAFSEADITEAYGATAFATRLGALIRRVNMEFKPAAPPTPAR